jgi:hypothetical protein
MTTTTIEPTVDQVALAIATALVYDEGVINFQGAVVEYRRHTPDQYEVRLAVSLPFLGVLVEHGPGSGWGIRSRVESDLRVTAGSAWETAQDAIRDAIRYLVWLDEGA